VETNSVTGAVLERRSIMPKYLFQSSLTTDGIAGTLKEGGSKRREAVEQAAKNLGGTMEAYYYAFGDTDVFTIIDFPDNVTAVTAALVVSAGGGAAVKTTVLITPEEVDAIAKKAAEQAGGYRPPGQ
jgi:uncharacterized protein with GYD domain